MDRFRRVGAPTILSNSGPIDIDMPEDARLVCTHLLLDDIITGASLDAAAQVADGGVLNLVGGSGNANYANKSKGITYKASGGTPIIDGVHFRFLRYLSECLGYNPGLVQGPGFMESKRGFAAATPSVVPYDQALDGTGLNVAMRVRAHVPFYHVVRGGPMGSIPLVALGNGDTGLDTTKAPGHMSLFDAQAVSSLTLQASYGDAVLTPGTSEGGGGFIEVAGAGNLTRSGRGFSASLQEAIDSPPARYYFSRLVSEIKTNPSASGSVAFDLKKIKGSILTGIMLVVLDDDSDARDPNICRLSDDFVGEISLQVGGRDIIALDWAEAQEIGRSAMGVAPAYHRPGVAFLPFNGDGAIRGAPDLTGPNPGNVTLELSTNAATGGDSAPQIAVIATVLDPAPPAIG